MSAGADHQPAAPSIARRCAALIYDLLLVLALLMLGTLPRAVMVGDASDQELDFTRPGLLFQLYCLTLIVGYFVLCWKLQGRTLGMKSWRLSIVSESAGTPSLGQLLMRALSAPIAWGALGAGVLWQHIDAHGRTWHDMASGTRMVVLKKT